MPARHERHQDRCVEALAFAANHRLHEVRAGSKQFGQQRQRGPVATDVDEPDGGAAFGEPPEPD